MLFKDYFVLKTQAKSIKIDMPNKQDLDKRMNLLQVKEVVCKNIR